MNDDQKKAIETLMPKLVEVLHSSLFEDYLSNSGFLNDNECQLVSASGPTNGHRIRKILNVTKWKGGSWETLMKFLRDHKYDWLAAELLIEAKMEPAKKPFSQQTSSTATPTGVQFAAAYSHNSASYQSPSISASQTSAKPQLRVPPVAKLVKSTSDLYINPEATAASHSNTLENEVGSKKETEDSDLSLAVQPPDAAKDANCVLTETKSGTTLFEGVNVPSRTTTTDESPKVKDEEDTSEEGQTYANAETVEHKQWRNGRAYVWLQCTSCSRRPVSIVSAAVASSAILSLLLAICIGHQASLAKQSSTPQAPAAQKADSAEKFIRSVTEQSQCQPTAALRSDDLCVLLDYKPYIFDSVAAQLVEYDPNQTPSTVAGTSTSQTGLTAKEETDPVSEIRLDELNDEPNSDFTVSNTIESTSSENESLSNGMLATTVERHSLWVVFLLVSFSTLSAVFVAVFVCCRSTSEVDDIDKLIAKLKEKLQLHPFAQLLPEIIRLMQIYSTSSKFQLECIQLIQASLTKKLSELSAELKENLVETMLTCLQSDFNDESIVDCCAGLLDKLEIFADPIDKYTQTVEILLKIISNLEMTTKTKRSTMWLLGWIIAQSDENRRNLVGQMGGVEQICEVVRQQLNNPTYDRISVVSWNCLGNLCRFSLENQNKFLSADGVGLFHHCYEKFGDEVGMVENMMWMMRNLSYFSSVRPQLVSKRNFDVFWKILLKFKDNVAISYRCVYTFANFLSDSTLIWPLDNPTVEEAKNLLIGTINKWQLDAKTNFNWSSFKSLLDNLKLHKSNFADLLRIWTIVNLTTVDDPKYCRMLSEEGVVEILTTEVISEGIRIPLQTRSNLRRLHLTTLRDGSPTEVMRIYV